MSAQFLITVIVVSLSCCCCVGGHGSSPGPDKTAQPAATPMGQVYQGHSGEMKRHGNYPIHSSHSQAPLDQVYQGHSIDITRPQKQGLHSSHGQAPIDHAYQDLSGDTSPQKQGSHSSHGQAPIDHAYQGQPGEMSISEKIRMHSSHNEKAINHVYKGQSGDMKRHGNYPIHSRQTPMGQAYQRHAGDVKVSKKHGIHPSHNQIHSNQVYQRQPDPIVRALEYQPHTVNKRLRSNQKYQRIPRRRDYGITSNPTAPSVQPRVNTGYQRQAGHNIPKARQSQPETSEASMIHTDGPLADNATVTREKQPHSAHAPMSHMYKPESGQTSMPQENQSPSVPQPITENKQAESGRAVLNQRYHPPSEQTPRSHVNHPQAGHISEALSNHPQQVHTPNTQEVQPQIHESHTHLSNEMANNRHLGRTSHSHGSGSSPGGTAIVDSRGEHQKQPGLSFDRQLLQMMKHMEIVHAYLKQMYQAPRATPLNRGQNHHGQAQHGRESGVLSPAVEQRHGFQHRERRIHTVPSETQQHTVQDHDIISRVLREFEIPVTNHRSFGHHNTIAGHGLNTNQVPNFIGQNQGATNHVEYEGSEALRSLASNPSFGERHTNSVLRPNTAPGRKHGDYHGGYIRGEQEQPEVQDGTHGLTRQRYPHGRRGHSVPGATIMFI